MANKWMQTFRMVDESGSEYDIPANEMRDFQRDMPGARQVVSFKSDGDTFDIPEDEAADFMRDMPKAQQVFSFKDNDGNTREMTRNDIDYQWVFAKGGAPQAASPRMKFDKTAAALITATRLQEIVDSDESTDEERRFAEWGLEKLYDDPDVAGKDDGELAYALGQMNALALKRNRRLGIPDAESDDYEFSIGNMARRIDLGSGFSKEEIDLMDEDDKANYHKLLAQRNARDYVAAQDKASGRALESAEVARLRASDGEAYEKLVLDLKARGLWNDAEESGTFTRKATERDYYDMRGLQRDMVSRQIDYVLDNPDKVDAEKLAAARRWRKTLDAMNDDPYMWDALGDEEVAEIVKGVDSLHKDAANRRGHLEVLKDALKRGNMNLGTQMYMGYKALAPWTDLEGEESTLRLLNGLTQNRNEASAPTKVGSMSNIHAAGDVLDFVLESTGENAQRMVIGTAAAYLTGGAAAALGAGATGVTAGAMVGSGVSTLAMNTGEAVQDQLDEGLRLSRGWALSQGAAYSVLDGAFGAEQGIARGLQATRSAVAKVGAKSGVKLLGRMAPKTAAEEAVKELRNVAKAATLKGWAANTLKTAAGEAIQEPAQSQIFGRLRRWGQTGTPLRMVEDKDGSMRRETAGEVFGEIFDEAMGGAAAALITGGLGAAGQTHNARRAVRISKNVSDMVTGVKEFDGLSAENKLLAGRYLVNQALLETTGVLDADAVKLAEEVNGQILNELRASGSAEDRKAVDFIGMLTSQFAMEDFGTALESAKADGVTSSIKKGDLLKSRKEVTLPDGTSGFVYAIPGSSVSLVEQHDGNGRIKGFVVVNGPALKEGFNSDDRVSLTDEEKAAGKGLFDKAVEKMQEMDVYNQYRAQKSEAKREVIADMAKRIYSRYGKGDKEARVVIVDNLAAFAQAAKDDAEIAGMYDQWLRAPDAKAAYMPSGNCVVVMADRINSLGQLYVDLMHEEGHRQIAEHLMGRGEGVGKGRNRIFGRDKLTKAVVDGDGRVVSVVTEDDLKDMGRRIRRGGLTVRDATDAERDAAVEAREETFAERYSVQDILNALNGGGARKDGLLMRLRKWMSNTSGLAVDSISDDAVRTELKHLCENGYLGREVQKEVAIQTAQDEAAVEAAIAEREALVRQSGDVRKALKDEADAAERARQQRRRESKAAGEEAARIIAEDGKAESVPPIDSAKQERPNRGADMEVALQSVQENTQEVKADEAGNGTDEAPAQPEQGNGGRQEGEEAPRLVEAEPARAEAADARVVEPPVSTSEKISPTATEKPAGAEQAETAKEAKPKPKANRLKRQDGTDPLVENRRGGQAKTAEQKESDAVKRAASKIADAVAARGDNGPITREAADEIVKSLVRTPDGKAVKNAYPRFLKPLEEDTEWHTSLGLDEESAKNIRDAVARAKVDADLNKWFKQVDAAVKKAKEGKLTKTDAVPLYGKISEGIEKAERMGLSEAAKRLRDAAEVIRPVAETVTQGDVEKFNRSTKGRKLNSGLGGTDKRGNRTVSLDTRNGTVDVVGEDGRKLDDVVDEIGDSAHDDRSLGARDSYGRGFTGEELDEGGEPVEGADTEGGGESRVVRPSGGVKFAGMTATLGEDGKISLTRTRDAKDEYGRDVEEQRSVEISEAQFRAMAKQFGVDADKLLKKMSGGKELEGRFKRSGVTPADDAAYMDAVRRGDTETAQRMVREAAAKAMPNTKVVDNDGLPLVVYHGGGLQKVHAGEIYTSSDSGIAKGYGKAKALFLDIENPRIIDANGNQFDDLFGETLEGDVEYGTSTDRIVTDTMYDPESKYDGVIIRNVVDNAVGDSVPSDVYVTFNMDKTQTKSADAITRDDAGNAIPLSQRFNPQNNDIRFKRRVSPPPAPTTKDIADWLDGKDDVRRKWRRALQDKNIGIRDVEEKLGITDKNESAYYAKDRAFGKNEHELTVLQKQEVEPIVEKIHKSGGDLGLFSAYLYARHAGERNAVLKAEKGVDNGSGMTDAQAKVIFNAVDRLGLRAAFEDAAKDVWAMNRKYLQRRVDAGRMTQAEADFLMKRYQHYVPLRTDMTNEELDIFNSTTGGWKRNETMTAKGRKSAADDPLAFSIVQNEQAIRASNANEVRKRWAGVVRRAKDELGEIVDGVNKGTAKWSFTFGDGETVETGSPMKLASERDDIILFKENGQLKAIKMKPGEHGRGIELARAVTDKDVVKFNEHLDWIPRATRWMSAMRTQYVPTFIVRNLKADNLEVMLNALSERGLRGAAFFGKFLKNEVSVAKGVKEYFKTGKSSDKYVQEAVENGLLTGGGMAAEGFTETARRLSDTLQALRERPKLLGGTLKAAKETISLLNSCAEYNTRIGVFKTLREEGMSVADAVSYARDVTVNFNRKGYLTPYTNAAFMFSNAAIQGMGRAFKSMGSEHGKSVVAGLFMVGVAQALLDDWLGHDDEKEKTGGSDSRNMTEYDKEHSLGVALPTGHRVKTGIRNPWALPMYAGRKTVELIKGITSGEQAMKDLANAVGNFVTEPVGGNGFGSKAEFLQTLAPTIIDPFVQWGTGKDHRGQDRLKKSFDKTAPQSWNGKDRTPDAYKLLAQGLNWLTGGNEFRKGWGDSAPEDWQLLTETVFGGVLTDLNNLVKAGGHAVDVARGKPAAQIARDVPFVRDTVTNLPENSNRYYAALEEYERDKAEFKKTTSERRKEMKADKPYLFVGKSLLDGQIEQVKKYMHLERGEVKVGQKWVEPKTPRTEEQKEKYRKLRLEMQARILKRLGE